MKHRFCLSPNAGLTTQTLSSPHIRQVLPVLRPLCAKRTNLPGGRGSVCTLADEAEAWGASGGAGVRLRISAARCNLCLPTARSPRGLWEFCWTRCALFVKGWAEGSGGWSSRGAPQGSGGEKGKLPPHFYREGAALYWTLSNIAIWVYSLEQKMHTSIIKVFFYRVIT